MLLFRDKSQSAILLDSQASPPISDSHSAELDLDAAIPENTKHLYNICTMLGQRRRRWANIVQMLYKCFVIAGI